MKNIQRIIVLAGFLMACAPFSLYAHPPDQVPTDPDSSPSGGSPQAAVDRGETVSLLNAAAQEKADLEKQLSVLKQDYQASALNIREDEKKYFQQALDDLHVNLQNYDEEMKEEKYNYDAYAYIVYQASAQEIIHMFGEISVEQAEEIRGTFKTLLMEPAEERYQSLAKEKADYIKAADEVASAKVKEKVLAQAARLEKIIELTNKISEASTKIQDLQKAAPVTFKP